MIQLFLYLILIGHNIKIILTCSIILIVSSILISLTALATISKHMFLY